MSDEAAQLATDDPDYAIRDLYNHISEGDFPSWSLKIQVMTFEEAEKFRYNPFDLTKVQCSLLSFIYIHIFVGKILIFNKMDNMVIFLVDFVIITFKEAG